MASEALMKLPFDNLGDLIDIDYYQSKESRMKEIDMRPNPIYQVLNQQLAAVQQIVRAVSPNRKGSPGKRQKSRGQSRGRDKTKNKQRH